MTFYGFRTSKDLEIEFCRVEKNRKNTRTVSHIQEVSKEILDSVCSLSGRRVFVDPRTAQ